MPQENISVYMLNNVTGLSGWVFVYSTLLTYTLTRLTCKNRELTRPLPSPNPWKNTIKSSLMMSIGLLFQFLQKSLV